MDCCGSPRPPQVLSDSPLPFTAGNKGEWLIKNKCFTYSDTVGQLWAPSLINNVHIPLYAPAAWDLSTQSPSSPVPYTSTRFRRKWVSDNEETVHANKHSGCWGGCHISFWQSVSGRWCYFMWGQTQNERLAHRREGLGEEAGQRGAEVEAWTLSCCDNRYQGSAQGPTALRGKWSVWVVD